MHVNSISWQHSSGKIRDALKTLPKELDEAYDTVLLRIYDQNKSDLNLAKSVLSWIAYAKRPLKAHEIQEAIAIEATSGEFTWDSLPEVEYIVLVCIGIVIVDPESNIIRLVHYTTQDYVLGLRETRLRGCGVTVAKSCLKSLSRASKTQPTTLSRFAWMPDGEPVWEYASEYWDAHVREEENELDDAILDFISEPERIYFVSYFAKWRAEAKKKETIIRFRLNRDHTALCFAAIFGLVKTVKTLFQASAYQGEVDVPVCGDTALHHAVENAHILVVQLLLQIGVQIDARNAVGETALDLATMGADPRTYSGALHPLSSNVRTWRDYDEISALLIKEGADVNITGRLEYLTLEGWLQ